MNFQKFIEGRKEGERDGEGRREKKNKKRKLAENLKRKITSGHCRAQYRQNVFSLVNNLIYTNKTVTESYFTPIRLSNTSLSDNTWLQ